MKNNNQNINLIFLIVGFLLTLFISYSLAIKKTMVLKQNYKQGKEELIIVQNGDRLINTLMLENKSLDSILRVNDLQLNSSFQQLLLNKVSKYIQQKKNLKLTSLSSPHVYTSKQIKHTYVVEVKGDFINLLKFLHYLESQRLGEVTSTTFIKTKNYRRNSFELSLKIYLQKLIAN